jgi:hypothetical protein
MSEEGRVDELWTRWLADGHLTAAEQQDLADALARSEREADERLADHRLDGALCALGREAHDGGAFARRFRERLHAEHDGGGFVSSFEHRLRLAARPLVPRAPLRPLRVIAWVAAPLALTLALTIALRGGTPAPSATAGPAATAQPLFARQGESGARRPVPPAVARVERVTGTAFLLDNARKAPAQPGVGVGFGMGLVTVGRDSRAVLAFPDGTSFELGGNTALVQISDSDRPGDRGKEAFLARGRLGAEVTPQPVGRPMLITTPQAEAAVVGTRFALTVEGRSTRLDVERGAVEIGRLSGGTPVTVRAAQFALVTEATDPTVLSTARGAALLVVGSLMLTPGDDRIKKRLETLGFDVQVRGVGAPDPEELRRCRVVLLSSSIFSLNLNTQYRDVPVPVVVWEPSLFDDLGMTGPEEHGGSGVLPSTGQLLIHDPASPLAAGLSGTVQVIAASPDGPVRARRLEMSFGSPGPQARWVASWPGRPDRAVVFAYERGAPMPGLQAAPARRVGLFLYDRTPPQLTDAGWALFDAALLWAAEAR